MDDKTLVERLELAANDAIHDDAANAIRAAILEMARLDAENFRLAAGSCDVEGGKIGDEHGHFRCSLQSRIEALEAALRDSMTAIDDWLHVYAYDMCDEADVRNSHKRIANAGGTLSYIASVQKQNRGALESQP